MEAVIEVDVPLAIAIRCGEVGPIHDDVYTLERDQAAADHRIEHRECTVDLLLRVDALDDDGQVARQPEELRLMEPCVRADE